MVDANIISVFDSYSNQLMHICIVWFAKVEKIGIIRLNGRSGSFLLGEAYSGSKRDSLIWKMT